MDEQATPHRDLELIIATTAADWVLRLEEDASARCRKEFSGWLKQSPKHIEAFLLTAATASGLRKIDPSRELDVQSWLQEQGSTVVSMSDARPRLTRTPAVDRGKHAFWLDFAAVAAIVATVAASAYLLQGAAGRDDYRTTAGEQRSLQLDDGSLAHLNTRSHLRIRYSEKERRIELLEGEALFVVARDATRPFRVAAGAAVIQAVGTEFNVYRQTQGTVVSVLEGRVKVTSSGHDAPLLDAGSGARVLGNGTILEQHHADVESSVAWRQRRLVFNRSRLDLIATEFNRYNRVMLHVEQPAAQRQLTGTFNANEPEAFVAFLRADPTLEVSREGNDITVRSHTGHP